MWQPIENTYTYHEIPQSKGIIIFVHGLTSDQNEEMFVQGEKIFNENGYSTIRFNLYGDLPGERKFSEVCLQDNIDDVNGVIDFCKAKGYKKIFLVGHSYGGIANLYANHDGVSGILMRDSSIGGEQLLSDVHLDENGKHYIDWGDGYRHYIGENLYQDFQISPEEFLQKISEIKVPIKIIGAEKGLGETAKMYYEYANEPKKLTIIPGADHRFLDGGMDELLKESLEWIAHDRLETIINKIVDVYKPYSIFLYGSKATHTDNINSDYELGIIFEDDKYISRHAIADLINNKIYSIFPFRLCEILNYDIDTPFQKTIYMNVLVHGGAKTLYGEKVIENMEPRIITKDDLLADIYFHLGISLSAVRVYKSGNNTLANDMFYKSCFYATRDLIYYLNKNLCISYKEIYETSQKIEVLNSYKEILDKAYYLRNNPNEKIDPKFFYNNISYINKYILQIIEKDDCKKI